MEIFRATVAWFLENGGATLTVEHHIEVPAVTAKPGEAEIDYAAYGQLEAEGYLLIMVGWEDEQIVGYVIGTASPSPHNKGAYEFSTTAFYTRPSHRGLGIGRALFDATCQYCKDSGITDVNYVVSESFPDAHLAVQEFGMIKAETTYSIRVKE